VPGLRRAGGLGAAIALAAPTRTLLHNAGGLRDPGHTGPPVVHKDELPAAAVVAWLLEAGGR